jgi:hypothetical protein
MGVKSLLQTQQNKTTERLVSSVSRKLAGVKQVKKMKRYGNLWTQICDIDNIREAAHKAVKGKKMTRQRRWFIENKESCIMAIQDSLINEDYQFGELYSFTIYEPKKREIHCPRFYPDRVLHHCVMNIVAPLFIEKLTRDTYSSIPGRGVAMLARKIQSTLRKNPDAYYLQIDIRKFYQSIDHGIAKEKVRRVIKCQKTLRLIDSIIDSHDEGMPIGAYPSQYIGNLILSDVDHWAKEVARVKHYFRYMDDMLFILDSKQEAHRLLEDVKEKIHGLKHEIKNNSRIAPVSAGIDFIGYKFYPTHTRLRKRIKQRMQRTVRRLRKQNVSDRYFMRKTASHFGWCIHADCRNLLRKIFTDKIYLYADKMEIKRLSEKKQIEWFGMPKEKRTSIENLFDKDIAFFDMKLVTIRGEEKAIVKFAFPDNPEDLRYFITRSDVMKDRLERDRELMPFVATIKKVKNYTAYE